MVRAGELLERLRAREDNYFGTFRAEIFLRELSLLEVRAYACAQSLDVRWATMLSSEYD